MSVVPVPIQQIHIPEAEIRGIRVYVKRADMVHPYISGNKMWKLKYNLEEAGRKGKDTLLTFGGAYSNHLVAVAVAGKEHGFRTVGVVRGEVPRFVNPALRFAEMQEMLLHHVSRDTYRKWTREGFDGRGLGEMGDFYLIPEGGSNELAVKGVSEMLGDEGSFDYVCCPCGTGATLAGLAKAVKPGTLAIGFAVLKGASFLEDNVRRLSGNTLPADRWCINHDYHFGGYARQVGELDNFVNSFTEIHGIRIEPVYTGRMFYGINDLLKKDFFKRESAVLAVHTGGVFVWPAFEQSHSCKRSI